MSAVLHQPTLKVSVGARDHVRGAPDAQHTLVEYGDYECPFCGAAAASVKQLMQIMGNEVRFAYRHFPLTQIHPHAQLAAEAAEAAGQQDRFWDMSPEPADAGRPDRLRVDPAVGPAPVRGRSGDARARPAGA